MKTIVIDVGHDNKYNKGIIKGYYESERMWKLGEYLIAELKKYDVKVVNTRAELSDKMSLSDRGRVAIRNKADLFVSLHSNASGSSLATANKDVKGTVIFYSVRQDTKKEANELAKVVAKAVGTTIDRVATWASSTRKGRDYLTVMDVAAYGGVPKVYIIEHGFHTNLNDCTQLMKDNVLKNIAIAEAKFFANALGVSIKEAPKPTPAPAPKAVVKYVATKKDPLNVRAKASILGKRVGKLTKGTKVTVVSVKGSWTKIKSGKIIGYVSSKYLSSKKV